MSSKSLLMSGPLACTAFSRKRFATIQSSWLDPRKVRDMTIVGTKRMIVYDDVEPLEKIKIYDARVEVPPPLSPPRRVQPRSPLPSVRLIESPMRSKQGLRVAALIHHFLCCVNAFSETHLIRWRVGLEMCCAPSSASPAPWRACHEAGN